MKPVRARKRRKTLQPKKAARNPRRMETTATMWYASVTVKDMLRDGKGEDIIEEGGWRSFYSKAWTHYNAFRLPQRHLYSPRYQSIYIRYIFILPWWHVIVARVLATTRSENAWELHKAKNGRMNFHSFCCFIKNLAFATFINENLKLLGRIARIHCCRWFYVKVKEDLKKLCLNFSRSSDFSRENPRHHWCCCSRCSRKASLWCQSSPKKWKRDPKIAMRILTANLWPCRYALSLIKIHTKIYLNYSYLFNYWII